MFKSNAYSWEGLFKSIPRRSYAVQVKYVPMVRFVVFVGRIVCGGQGREIVSFMTKTRITGKKYVHW